MKVVSNEKLIVKNTKIGKYTSIGSLLVLAIGLFASFNIQYINYSFIALIIGFVLSQIGIYYSNRWGKSPRPDELITQALKGIGDKYTLYHYSTRIPHLLVGPAGIWTLIPLPQGGKIIYDTNKNRFKQKGGNLYLKIFAQESLGRPDIEAKETQHDAIEYLNSKLGELELPAVEPILIFTNPKAILECSEAPFTVLAIDKLKDFIRKQGKEQPISIDLSQLIQKTLPQEG